MTEGELMEIERRATLATPGPWMWEDWSQDDGPDPYTLTVPPETMPGGPSKMFPDLRHKLLTDEDHEVSPSDRAFIAHARADIPALLAEIRRLKAAR